VGVNILDIVVKIQAAELAMCK